MANSASESSASRLPKDSLILVTAANSFIASNLCDALLKAGYRVRGTVRDVKRISWMQTLLDERYGKGRFELFEVPDFTAPGCYDGAIKGCSAVANLASEVSFSPNPNEVIPAVLKSINQLFAACISQGDAIKSFVQTSSSTAATKPKPGVKFHIDSNTWNEEDVQDAWREPPYEPERAWAVYGASKTQGEQEVWKLMRDKKPAFTVNSVLPNANFGAPLSPENQKRSTAAWITSIMDGKFDELKNIPPQYYVAVMDTVRLHVALLTNLKYNGNRVFAFAAPYNWNAILAILRKLRPDDKRDAIPADIPNEGEDLSTVDVGLSLSILKDEFGQDGWISLEQAIRENVDATVPVTKKVSKEK